MVLRPGLALRARSALLSAAMRVVPALGMGVAPALSETISVNGKQRTYEAAWAATSSAPLVIVLHGALQTGAMIRRHTSWSEVARANGFSVLFPDGLGRAWADYRAPQERFRSAASTTDDDTAFLAALVDRAVADGRADPKRVYITGVSNGGAMTMTMICERPGMFAAAGVVIMALTETAGERCRATEPQARPIPILFMNGTADPLIPFNGGKSSNREGAPTFLSAEATARYWRQRNGCKPEPGPSRRYPGPTSKVTVTTSECPAGGDVELIAVEGGGHSVPSTGASSLAMRAAGVLLGPQNHDIDGAGTIWSFFQRSDMRR